jgi:decaprenyl-phosphate phosphoribosyltransferase
MRLGEGEPLTTTMMGEQLVPLFLALRPKQWLKNSLVVAAPLAGGIAFRWHSASTIALLFMLLCMVSSAGYLLNDVHDRDYDRAHPIKRHRAIASGAVSVPQAVGLASALIVLAVLAAFSWTDPATTLLLVCYVVTTITYSLYLKTIPGVEMVVVSAGFLLRAIIGGVGTGTELSGWFLVVICAAALLVVAGKRLSELQRLEHTKAEPKAHERTALRAYSVKYLTFVTIMSATFAVAAYAVWVLFVGVHRDNPLLLVGSIIPLGIAIARYVGIIRAGGAETPEDALISDAVMVACGGVWLLSFAAAVVVAQ